YRLIARDGRVVWVYDDAVYLRGVDGHPASTQGFLVDITERKRLEEELRQAQRMEAGGRLAGGVAHGFNNVLPVILGYVRLLEQELAGDEGLSREIEQIGRAAERAATLTQQLLAFSRRQVLRAEVLDLNQVVHELERMLERLIGEDVELETSL